jgi:hypothetical protein
MGAPDFVTAGVRFQLGQDKRLMTGDRHRERDLPVERGVGLFERIPRLLGHPLIDRDQQLAALVDDRVDELA